MVVVVVVVVLVLVVVLVVVVVVVMVVVRGPNYHCTFKTSTVPHELMRHWSRRRIIIVGGSVLELGVHRRVRGRSG